MQKVKFTGDSPMLRPLSWTLANMMFLETSQCTAVYNGVDVLKEPSKTTTIINFTSHNSSFDWLGGVVEWQIKKTLEGAQSTGLMTIDGEKSPLLSQLPDLKMMKNTTTNIVLVAKMQSSINNTRCVLATSNFGGKMVFFLYDWSFHTIIFLKS